MAFGGKIERSDATEGEVSQLRVGSKHETQNASSSSTGINGQWANRFLLRALICLVAAVNPQELLAVDWPWSKKPDDVVTAACTLDRNQVEQGATALLRAQVTAADSRGHPLSYVWSGNGGKIAGVGTDVQVDPSGLNPGVYSVKAQAQDAYQHSASCTLSFQVLPPPDTVVMTRCTAEPSVVEQGKDAVLDAQASDALGHPLRYHWYTNGGQLTGEGPRVKLETAGVAPGVYTVTGRVEDGSGLASDCMATVKVELPPPPPPVPPQPTNIAEIVFPRNRVTLEGNDQGLLQKVLARLITEPAGRVSIEAYAGPDETDPGKLAAERAETVKRFFVENGVAESRVQTLVGLGGWRGGLRNRTLDVIWLPKGIEY